MSEWRKAMRWNRMRLKHWIKRTPQQFRINRPGETYKQYQAWLQEVRRTVKPQPRPPKRET